MPIITALCLDQRYYHKIVLAEVGYPIVKSTIRKWKHCLYVGIFYLTLGLGSTYLGPSSGHELKSHSLLMATRIQTGSQAPWHVLDLQCFAASLSKFVTDAENRIFCHNTYITLPRKSKMNNLRISLLSYFCGLNHHWILNLPKKYQIESIKEILEVRAKRGLEYV